MHVVFSENENSNNPKENKLLCIATIMSPYAYVIYSDMSYVCTGIPVQKHCSVAFLVFSRLYGFFVYCSENNSICFDHKTSTVLNKEATFFVNRN